MMIATHRHQGLLLATLNDIKNRLGEQRTHEIEMTTPVIKSFAARCVRVSEIDEFSDLSIDEDSKAYDMYDIYYQSSNHVLATLTMLKVVGKTIDDLPEEAKKIANSLEANERELRVLRKHVIELVYKEMKGL